MLIFDEVDLIPKKNLFIFLTNLHGVLSCDRDSKNWKCLNYWLFI